LFWSAVCFKYFDENIANDPAGEPPAFIVAMMTLDRSQQFINSPVVILSSIY
jgi:hypothetical protein